MVESTVKEDCIEFKADSFSVYAIIEGPSPLPPNQYESAQNLDELANNGFYMSITRNSNTYYFRNYINNKNCIARTDNGKISDAALYHFEPVVNGGENEYYLYTTDPNRNRVYDTSGIAPCVVNYSGGGNLQPIVSIAYETE